MRIHLFLCTEERMNVTALLCSQCCVMVQEFRQDVHYVSVYRTELMVCFCSCYFELKKYMLVRCVPTIKAPIPSELPLKIDTAAKTIHLLKSILKIREEEKHSTILNSELGQKLDQLLLPPSVRWMHACKYAGSTEVHVLIYKDSTGCIY